MAENKKISNFYANKEIFISGGSGFLGRFLIEKLLRSCPKVKTIYVLMRPKKGKSIDDRISEFFDSQLFDKLRNSYPENMQKLKVINGDIMEVGLGISEYDMQKLSNVSIIFHVAASVRFDDPIKNAILMNTKATYEMIKFAKKLKNITVFVHVSTAYCNPDKHYVQEKIYPAYTDWRDAIKIAETFNQESLESVNEKFRCLLPNGYTFTKNLAESIIQEFKDEIPCIIYRPTIVTASLNDPLPGWVENFNGPMANLIACGMGISRTSHADPNVEMDFIPADCATRALIIAGYKKGNSKDPYQVDVYNGSMGKFQTITGGLMLENGKIAIKENPFERTVYVPGGTITCCYAWHIIRYILFQISIALVLDTIMKFVMKKKPILMKLQRKIILGVAIVKFFVVTAYDFQNDNFSSLEKLIPPEEYEEFTFLKHVPYDLEDFYRKTVIGLKVALLNEPPQASAAAKRRFKILTIVHKVYCGIIFLLTTKFIVLPLLFLIKSKI